MRIRWPNVVAVALAIIGIAILIRNVTGIQAFLSAMYQIGPGHSPEDQVRGLIAFGLVLVAFLAVLKIVIDKERKG